MVITKVRLFSCGGPPALWCCRRFCLSPNSRREPSPAFSSKAQAQRKSYKKETPKKAFALCGVRQGLLALDRATFKKVDETFGCFALAPHPHHHFRESARLLRALVFARAVRGKPRGKMKPKILPKQAIKKSRRYIESSAAHIFLQSLSHAARASSLYTREPIQGKARADFDIRKSLLFRSAGLFSRP